MAPALISPSRACAYVTFLAGAGDYIMGVSGLAKGLQNVKSAYPLVVAVLADVPEAHRQLLRMQGCVVREIQPIRPARSEHCVFAMPHYVLNYSKLRIWLFEEYEKIVYLDADIMVYDNIDNLFDLPDGRFHAVMDCFCEHTWSHSPQYKVKYCQQCPDRNPWPKELGELPAKYFNAGMFVHEPSKKTFDELMVALRKFPPTPFAEQLDLWIYSFPFLTFEAEPNQDLLNTFFQKIYSPIPLVYNLVMAMLWRHPENVQLEKVKVVHYCATGSKPWEFTGKEENMDREDLKTLVEKWWEIYDGRRCIPSSPRVYSLEATHEIVE